MGEGLRIKPITFKTASEYVNKYHRHHRSSIGCKFCIGVFDGDVMHGVAICGRPVSRVLDDGATCEITRVCTDGARNACSMLYGACQRIAREMGYEQIITYTLVSEGGQALKQVISILMELLAGRIGQAPGTKGSLSQRN